MGTSSINMKNIAIISSIIQLLMQGYEVIYKPRECGMDTGKGCYLEMLVKKRMGMDLAFFPLNDDSKWRHFLRPPINTKQPIYFNMSSSDSLLIKILRMFSSIDDLSKYLNKGSYQIISRIRIKYCFTIKNMNDKQDYPQGLVVDIKEVLFHWKKYKIMKWVNVKCIQ